ncbi:adenine nucleotide translocase lysine N-methyltransferase isoform X3 [Narcine bancroftii]|uniref:adenine nucleotide translocase lysine N-methyltransferase isoform X3 n=1 Tax=Narcine bancroftii TaxID=1343680 RepID=UPI003831969A
MDQDNIEEEPIFQNRSIGGWGLLQIAGCTGLTAYVVWAGILMPGFRRVPLRLQVPYVPASSKQVQKVMTLLEGRSGNVVDLGSGDGRIVDLSHCSNVTVFLAPSVLSKLEGKLLSELPEDAWIVAGRFPFPSWKPYSVVASCTSICHPHSYLESTRSQLHLVTTQHWVTPTFPAHDVFT